MQKTFASHTVAFSLGYSAPAQVSITTLGPGGAYTQDFTALTSANFPLTNNTSIPGVYAERVVGDTTPNTFFVDNGSGTATQFKNFGPIGNADRALGSLADGDAGTTGDMHYGIRFQNATGVTITSVEVRYVGEQWRDQSTADHILVFSYLQAGTVTDLTDPAYINVASLNFTTPISSGGGQLDGNDSNNSDPIIGGFAVNIPDTQEIMLRWTDFAEVGANHGVAIDDVVVIFRAGTTAKDATISGRVATANGRAISGARIVLTGGDLSVPVYALTNAFGYFTFTGIESGHVYVLTVNSKRYSFANPTRTINLSDSATGVDFVADP